MSRYAEAEQRSFNRETERATVIVVPESTEFALAEPSAVPEHEKAEERRQEAMLARRAGLTPGDVLAKMAEAVAKNGEPTSKREYHVSKPMNTEAGGITWYGSHGLRAAIVHDDGSRDVTFMNWIV